MYITYTICKETLLYYMQIFKINYTITMKNIINFSDWQPSYDLFPIKLRKELSFNYKDIKTFYHYSPKAWLISTRKTFIKIFGWKNSNIDNCIITNWTLWWIELIVKSLGFGIIIIDEPTYADAIDIFKKYWIKIICVPRDKFWNINFKLFGETLLKYHKKKINIWMYLIPTLNNPDWKCLNIVERKKITALCIKYNIYCMEDDAYAYLINDSWNLPSLYTIAWNKKSHRIIRLLSLSKILMPGLRISFIEANKDITDILLKNKLDYWYSPLDCYIAERLLSNIKWIKDWIWLIKKKSDDYIKYLVDIFKKNNININTPLGGYFLWINLGNKNILELEKIALKNNICFTNGNNSFIQNKYNFIRICPMKLSKRDMKIWALKLIKSIKECKDF